MKLLKKLMLSLGIAVAGELPVVAAGAEPDFAHPRKVISEAYATLNAASGNAGSGPQRVRALLELCAASRSIDPDSIYALAGTVSEYTAKEKNGTARALMQLIEARLLSDAYNMNRWVYDRLETPADPLPADIREWNGTQFRREVADKALTALKTAEANPAPLADYSGAVSADRLTLLYFPSVTDFVAETVVGLLDRTEAAERADSVISARRNASAAGSPAYYYWSVEEIRRSAADVRGELYRFYMQHRDDEYARLALDALADMSGVEYAVEVEDGTEPPVLKPDDSELISLIEQSLERFPGYWDNNSLKNSLARLRRGKVDINYPDLVCPGKAFDVEVEAAYAAKAGVNVYAVTPAMLASHRGLDFSKMKPVKSLSLDFDKEQGRQQSKMSLTLDTPGAYALSALVDGKSNNSRYYYNNALVVCTPYVPVAFTGTSEQVVVMADFAAGNPVAGVRVLTGTNLGTNGIPVATTDKNGLARFRLSTDKSYYVSAISPDGRKLFFGNKLSVRSPWRGRERDEHQFNASVMPSRPIYHPGDTLEWVMVADCSSDGMLTRAAASELKAEVIMRDANNQPVDTAAVVTDRFGRAFGNFSIPQDGLSGYFSVLVKVDSRIVGRTSVMVSDYKMPVFEITGVNVLRDEPGKGEVSIKGRAVTYSGMPVADARVSVVVSQALRWRWWIPSRRIGTVDAVTDAAGHFTAVVPASMLDGSAVHDFSAAITVTSASAETADTTVPFSTGRPYLISIGGSDYIKAVTRTHLPITVYDGNGDKADIRLRWKLVEKGSGKVAADGECSSMSPVADLDRVRGGYYRLQVQAADTTLAEDAESGYFTLYNVELNSIPADLPLLVATSSVQTDVAGRASFQYGVGKDDTWLYAALCAGKEIVEVEVQKRDRGFRHLSLDLPKGSDEGVLKLVAVRDGKVYAYSVDIRRPEHRTLVIEGESFRDRLVPGASEHWQLKIKADDGSPVDAAFAATMYNHSLDALQQMSWPVSFPLGRVWPTMSLDVLSAGMRDSQAEAPLKTLDCDILSRPEFRYWSIYGMARNYNRMMMKSALMSAAPEAEMAEDNAAPMMNTAAAATGGMADGVVEEEVAVEETSGAAEAGPEKFAYRDAVVEQAFWQPALSADSQGCVSLDFRLPDANTTWRMTALAWTEDMKAGAMVRDFVANKPVMVQPNLPRFMRQGDKARVLATVFNNSSEIAELKTVVEIFDASTMEVVASGEQTDRVEADGSARVGIDIDVPANATAIGYRVRCTNGEFADGEQSLIPVESAQCDVVESTTFYLNPGDKDVKIKVPSDKNGTYTLQYCQNPSWAIVKALPGLVNYDSSTSTEAVHALFAACTARGIVRNVPMISEAIGKWNGDDLKSRLEQNDALKIAELRATPWVQAAQSDSERMARLALLLDGKRVQADIDAAVKILSALACADGGLRWGRWSDEASLWATQLALHDIGLLRMAGYYPENSRLTSIMHKALAYMDRELDRTDEKVRPDMGYAVVRSLWKDVAPSARGNKVVQATLQDCIRNWRTATTSQKANMAILLDIYGYGNVAREIMKSVDEFAVATPAQGVSFPSVSDIEQYAPMLIAYGKIDPTSQLIDGMRQWMVVREQATVGLGASDATQLVGAFLNSGTPWHTDNAPASVTLRGHVVNLGDAPGYGGEATIALGREAAGGTLRISPSAKVPSYGALISSYRSLPSDVKASSCDALSIEKRMVEVGQGGVSAYADSVSLGSRVRVVLTLHVERDMQYVTIIDERAATLEPVEQTPGYVVSGGARFYRENRDASTRMFINYLPKGTYQISYDCTANNEGVFAGGLATVQSALAPALTAHSAGSMLIVH